MSDSDILKERVNEFRPYTLRLVFKREYETTEKKRNLFKKFRDINNDILNIKKYYETRKSTIEEKSNLNEVDWIFNLEGELREMMKDDEDFDQCKMLLEHLYNKYIDQWIEFTLLIPLEKIFLDNMEFIFESLSILV